MKGLLVGQSIYRDIEKNSARGWTLIALSAEPSLYLNVQLDGEILKQIHLPSKKGAIKVGEMIAHLPITMDMEHEAFAQEPERVWRGDRPLSVDRDLYRVQIPTHAAIQVLEHINTLLPAGDRFEIYRGVGMTRGDYTQKANVKVGRDGTRIVVDPGHGRYCVIDIDGTVHCYEKHKCVSKVLFEDNPLEAMFQAIEWANFEPIVIEEITEEEQL